MEVSGPRTDRVLTIRVLDAAGKERWTRQIKASELK
jgi:alkaline phosphatase D